ncbi:GNAT family N-acetyltransferase [Streptomyces sp. NPDC028635]|uniref:GNAT family N-acetyltransferase n=1 Tax=Streptomyces sp. NPDC028635 TaxID=3154800 RepID=UPI0033CE81F8
MASTDSLVTGTADSEDTLDLHLPADFLALRTAGEPGSGEQDAGAGHYAGAARDAEWSRDEEAARVAEMAREAEVAPDTPPLWSTALPLPGADLLDQVAEWGATTTAAGEFQLVPVRPDRDVPLICRWMNDPAVAAFWELAGPADVTEAHLAAQLTGDGRSVPCLGVLDGTPMSYWELYRADLDPLARHYPARPHDTGIHLLLGGVADRGRGVGSALLRAVADLVLDRRPACTRVVAEPDVRNVPSLAAFLNAGFRFSAEVDLPGKRAALMIRDRSLRSLL